ncbi:MAG: NYN domain-containing protein [Nanoarchaeota archaeon]
MGDSYRKVAFYIDGSNFYFSIKKTFNCKVNIEKFCRRLTEDNNLVKINYYISPVNRLTNQSVYIEQQKFLAILNKIEKLSITLGRLERRKRKGEIHYVEKANDVNLALDLVLDAQSEVYDIAYLLSNDGDFSGAVSAAINRFKKKVIYVGVGSNKNISYHLKNVASRTIRIDYDFVNEVKL